MRESAHRANTEIENLARVATVSTSHKFLHGRAAESNFLLRQQDSPLYKCACPRPVLAAVAASNNFCGNGESTVADEQVEFTSEQIQAPDSANPAPWKWTSSSVTVTIVALNALVYILMLARGLSWIQPSAYDLLAWGADYGPRTLDGQWWRMFVSLFLHYGIIHLAFNMWVLANIGPFIESLSGRASFLILYIVAGLGGGAASLVGIRRQWARAPAEQSLVSTELCSHSCFVTAKS